MNMYLIIIISKARRQRGLHLYHPLSKTELATSKLCAKKNGTDKANLAVLKKSDFIQDIKQYVVSS